MRKAYFRGHYNDMEDFHFVLNVTEPRNTKEGSCFVRSDQSSDRIAALKQGQEAYMWNPGNWGCLLVYHASENLMEDNRSQI